MKKIKVIVKERTMLELLEDGSKGDLIDLGEVIGVDTSYIEKIIEDNKDKVYEAKLSEQKKVLEVEAKANIEKLEQKIKSLESEKEKDLKLAEARLEKEYSSKLAKLEQDLNLLKATKEADINNVKLALQVEHDNELAKQKDKYDLEIKEKEDMINNLQRQKAALNVKQTGEDLEAWCDNEVTSYMQNGLFNCTWTKDNKVIKNEDEARGSKADYIFKVFADNLHKSDELLASVCLDMKDENPDSKNKKTNADYYKQLDSNREKKNCKYAVLVSNLEMDKPNTLPIFKVKEYDNMYVVRPGYLMVFLNMITSLTTRFSSLVLSKEKEVLELKNKLELAEAFEEIKNKYLDKPLANLEKNIEEIEKNNESIKNSCKKIDEQCEKVKLNYLNQIVDKLNDFELKLNKSIIKKMEE